MLLSMHTTASETIEFSARNLISSAVNDTGAAINCITLAELYAGPRRGEEIEQDMRQAGIAVLDLPAGAAAICGRAYRRYRLARTTIGRQAKLPACRCLISSSARTQSWWVGSWPRGMSSGIAFIFLQSS